MANLLHRGEDGHEQILRLTVLVIGAFVPRLLMKPSSEGITWGIPKLYTDLINIILFDFKR